MKGRRMRMYSNDDRWSSAHLPCGGHSHRGRFAAVYPQRGHLMIFYNLVRRHFDWLCDKRHDGMRAYVKCEASRAVLCHLVKYHVQNVGVANAIYLWRGAMLRQYVFPNTHENEHYR